MRNQSIIYLGLFLIAFGLYASQIKKIPRASEVKPVTSLVESTPVPAPQNRIQVLYDKISAQKIFSNTVDGVKLTPSHAPIKNDFIITLYGDEMFSDENFSISTSWTNVLDQIADFFKPELGLKMEITGYADADNTREQKPSDYGNSAYAFSYARAEWLLFESTRSNTIHYEVGAIKKTDKNPTLTITALAWRTAEYLAGEMRKGNV